MIFRRKLLAVFTLTVCVSLGAVTALVLAIASVTGLLRRAPTLLAFAGMMIALGLLFAGLSYGIVLDSDERLRLRERGQLILQRLRMQQA